MSKPPRLPVCPLCGRIDRAIHRKRTRAGLKAAKARGVHLGRQPSLTPAKIRKARRMIKSGNSPRFVARCLGVHRATLYRHLARAKA